MDQGIVITEQAGVSKQSTKPEFRRQYLAFWAFHLLSDIFIVGFFHITLLKVTNNVEIVIISSMLNALTSFVGIILGGVLLDKIGYLKLYKLHFGLTTLGLIIFILLAGDLGTLYPIYAILIFLPRGLFWMANNSYLLKETVSAQEIQLLNKSGGIRVLMTVIFMPLAGWILTTANSILPVLLIGIVVNFLPLTLLFNYNKVPRSAFSRQEIVAILRRKGFKTYFFITYISEILASVAALLGLLVPFIILGSEFSVGLILAVVALVSAVTMLAKNQIKSKNMNRIGMIGNIILAVINVAYTLIWTPLALVINNITASSISGWADSAHSNLDLQARKRLLGSEINRSTPEMNAIIEATLTLARVSGALITIMILRFFTMEVNSFYRITFAVTGVGGIISFVMLYFYNRKYHTNHKSESNP